jgi:hypothetical protein
LLYHHQPVQACAAKDLPMKRQIMKTSVLGLLVLVLALAAQVTASGKGSGSMVIDWAKGGKTARVDFSKHTAKGVKCVECHVLHKDGKRHMSGCGGCHNTTANALKTGHKLCLDCHKARRAPTACEKCH